MNLRNNAGIGCYYKNNFNPLVYEFKNTDHINITVRSYQDSFIAAETITQSCSSTNIYGNYCINVYGKGEFSEWILNAYLFSLLIIACILALHVFWKSLSEG